MKRFAIGRAPMGDYVNTSLNKQTELPLSLNETARHEYVSNDFNIYVDELTASVSKNELAEIQKAYRDLKANQQ